MVLVGRQEDDGKEEELIARTGDIYRQTSYNTHGGVHYNPETGEPSADQSKSFRKNYAGIGYTYDEERDAFIPPRIFESWSLNEESCLWEPPMPIPMDKFDENGNMIHHAWNEESQTWEPIEEAS